MRQWFLLVKRRSRGLRLRTTHSLHWIVWVCSRLVHEVVEVTKYLFPGLRRGRRDKMHFWCRASFVSQRAYFVSQRSLCGNASVCVCVKKRLCVKASVCKSVYVIKWDSTCHSQTHGTEPPVHFCCSNYISLCFLSTSPFHSLSLSLLLSLSFSLSLSLPLYLSPLFLSVVARHMSSDALYQIFSSWSILLFYIISFHSSYKIHQLFTDYLLRLPSSELLEKHLFRSRANRRLVPIERGWFSSSLR